MQFNSGDIFAEHYQLEKKLGTGSFGKSSNLPINYIIPTYYILIILMYLKDVRS